MTSDHPRRSHSAASFASKAWTAPISRLDRRSASASAAASDPRADVGSRGVSSSSVGTAWEDGGRRGVVSWGAMRLSVSAASATSSSSDAAASSRASPEAASGAAAAAAAAAAASRSALTRAAFRRGDGGFGLARFALRAGPSASVGRAGAPRAGGFGAFLRGRRRARGRRGHGSELRLEVREQVREPADVADLLDDVRAARGGGDHYARVLEHGHGLLPRVGLACDDARVPAEGRRGVRREKREATGRANAGGPAGFRARRWTGRGRRARTRRVQAAVREAAVQPLPPGKLLRRGEGGEGSAELEEGRQGTEPGRGHGEEAPRSRRAPPPDAPRCRPPRPRATSRARPRRAESRARRGARPRRASSSRRGVTVTTSPRRVVRGKLRRPVPPYRSGTTTRSQPRVPARAAGETDGFDVPRKPRTRRSRRNASGGRPEANVGTFREKEAFFALRSLRVAPREVASHLFIGSRLRRPSRWTSSKS